VPPTGIGGISQRTVGPRVGDHQLHAAPRASGNEIVIRRGTSLLRNG
jgi:hypothetical protein